MSSLHHGQGCDRDARGGLPALVPRSHRRRRDGRQRPGPRHHGDPPVGLRDLGAHAVRARPAHQGGRGGERLLPPLHPRVLPGARGGARRGFRSRAGRGDPRRWQRARRAPRGAAHVRDGDQPLLFQVGAEPPRPSTADEPVGQRRAVGAAPPPLPAHERIPLAGRAHRPRHAGGRPGVRPPHPQRRLPHDHGRRARHSGPHRVTRRHASASPEPFRRGRARA